MDNRMSMLLQMDANSGIRIDILVWIIGIPLVLVFLVMLYYQVKQYLGLRKELVQLSKIKRHNIEYELVLKAMKLSTWRLDVPTETISFESDYRDKSDNFVPPPGADVNMIFQQIDESCRETVRKAIHDVMEGKKEDFHQQYQLHVPHSSKVYWAETFATVDKRDVDGLPLTIVGTTMRIDDQKEIEHALIEARNHAQESDRLKSAFIANITHEVRTPLNAIVGFSDVLPMAQSEEERNELIKLIKQNNAHLLRLFDDMVNISKLEAGNDGSVEQVDFELQPMMRELMDKYFSVCMDKGLEIKLDEAVGDDVIHTDRDRLKEILNQYVNNAVKFTEKGSITLGYSKSPSRFRIWVKDTGKGIPEEKCNEHLFERFVKVDDFIAGTGLGLSICLSLANSLGGTVGVKSVYEKGSTFWVDIPV